MIIKYMKTMFYIIQQMSVLVFISLLTLLMSLGLFSVFTLMHFKKIIGDKLRWI